MNREGKSLFKQMLLITILPLIVVGFVIMVVCYKHFNKSMYLEVRSELKNVAIAVERTYDDKYPGDYVLTDGAYFAVEKGGNVLNSNYEYLDYMKEKTGLEISLLYSDVRFLTTFANGEGERYVSTKTHANVKQQVLHNGTEMFYDNAKVLDESYFVYYMPLCNEDGKVVGMVEIGKDTAGIDKMVRQAVLPIIVVVLVFTILVAGMTFLYSKNMINNIKHIERSLKNITKGNLSYEVENELLKRKDELGNIGVSVKEMQKELKKNIEQDALTEVHNRGNGQKLLKKVSEELQKSGTTYTLALGDIDYFKKVNDNYGHECGDIVLKKVAGVMKGLMRKKGFVSRWGGEEFLLVFQDMDFDRAKKELEDIVSKINDLEIFYGEATIKVTMTFGVVEGKADKSIEELIKLADDKLYKGKADGRNRIVI